MTKGSVIALTLTAFIFTSFLLNLLMGAFHDARFMSDVAEMIVLLATSVCFVAAILLIEKQEQDNQE